jgi:glucose-6-phosphate 1-dehydrogenase
MELKDNTVIVVLGASGDLAKKKTVRTSLAVAQLLPIG